MRYCIYLATSFLALGYLFNCTSEPKEKEYLPEETLPGYWELLEAKRNGKNVPSLKGAYFELGSDKTISTNYSGEQVVSDYTIIDNSIVYQDSSKDQKLDFTILSQDTIVFETILRKIWKYELTLLRVDKMNK